MDSFTRQNSRRSTSDVWEGSVSFKRATREMMREGIHTLVSLKGDSEISQEIECMAAEFTQITKGEIESVISPVSLKLTKESGSQKVKLSTLQNIVSIMKKTAGKEYPYYRIDKVKILYIPLFDSSLGKGEEITFSLRDTSIASKESQVLSSVSVPLNSMSMSEMSMSFFTRSEDIKFIELSYNAFNVPIVGRSYASLLIGFYIHKDFSPAMIQPRKSITLMIDNVESPIDINKTSSIKSLCKRVQDDVKEKREQMKIKMIKYNQEESERIKGIFTENKVSENSACSEMQENCLTKEDIKELLPRSIPFVLSNEILLDTSATNHWIYNPSFQGDMNTLEESPHNNSINYFIINNVTEIKLGNYWVRLKNICCGSSYARPIISYSRLVESGIINCIKTNSSGQSMAMKDDNVMFHLENIENGKMMFSLGMIKEDLIIG
nr:TPA_asm: movement protein [Erythranthe ophiovirus]